MAVCTACSALKKRVKVLERQLAAVESARDQLILELEQETEIAWEICGDLRVKLSEVKGPREFPMPLFSEAKGGAA